MMMHRLSIVLLVVCISVLLSSEGSDAFSMPDSNMLSRRQSVEAMIGSVATTTIAAVVVLGPATAGAAVEEIPPPPSAPGTGTVAEDTRLRALIQFQQDQEKNETPPATPAAVVVYEKHQYKTSLSAINDEDYYIEEGML
mmetsp:Transcript_11310/g.12685  ORF Transcript_11310/g.12685 Transcript_11310/m.12685 type:complete len:140 (-) Transcript_11310:193-612(-)